MNQQDLKINSDHNTTFEFELKAEGVDVSHGIVSFVIIGEQFNYEFTCNDHLNCRYSVTIPASLKLKPSQQYIVRIAAEGFLFEPSGGVLSCVDNKTVKSSKIERIEKETPAAVIEIESPKQPKVTPKRTEESVQTIEPVPVPVPETVQSALDGVLTQPTVKLSNISKTEAQQRVQQILDDEKAKSTQAEQQRREREKAELAQRQHDIHRELKEREEKRTKLQQIAAEFSSTTN